MASSNRHWPSLFKSKPCNSHNQWQHEINSSLLSSTACQKTPYTSGCEERSPEPKPRWNPKPEQIRILESIFNSGLVNPPREEIRKIRAQLQEYGQVGDANVFYWFQNRKSRSKHKQRHHHHHHQHQPKPKLTTQQAPPLPTLTPAGIPLMLPTATSSSSSSSDKSSPGPTMIKTLGPTTTTTTTTNFIMEMSNSPTASVNQGFYQEDNNNNYYNQTPAAPTVAVQDPFYFQVQSGSPGFSQGSCWFSELSKMVQFAGQVQGSTHCSGLLMSELNACGGAGGELDGQEKMKLEQNQCYTINGMPEIGDSSAVATAGPPKLMVFINDVAFEVAVGPINVREAFGEGAVLYYSTGVPVPTNEWGLTLGALQHGSSYYLV